MAKKNFDDSVTVTVNWHLIKSGYSSSSRIKRKSYESDQWTYQEMSAVTNDFNHPSQDYVNFVSTNLSAQMMSTQNYIQNGW